MIKGAMIAAGILTVGILLLLFGGESRLLHVPARLLRAEPGSLLWLIDSLQAVIYAPLTEEILCRGMLYGWLTHKYGLAAGRIVNSLVFAALHGNVAMLPATFLVGFALTLLYEQTRSLAPCIVAHGAGNLISVVLAIFSGDWM